MSIESIKCNAVLNDTLTGNFQEYIKYSDWLEKENRENNNETFAKFLDEHFGCDLVRYSGINDKNGVELFVNDKTKLNGKIYKIIDINGAIGFVDEQDNFWEYACNLATNKFGEYVGNIYQ